MDVTGYHQGFTNIGALLTALQAELMEINKQILPQQKEDEFWGEISRSDKLKRKVQFRI